MKKVVRLLIILGIFFVLVFLAFESIDPIEKSLKEKDSIRMRMIASSGKSREISGFGGITYKGDLVNGPFIVFAKLEARFNYSRCDVGNPVAWGVYSSLDKKTGIVCLPKDVEPKIGSQQYLP